MSDVNIRLECLRPAERWVQPTGAHDMYKAGEWAVLRASWAWVPRATARCGVGLARIRRSPMPPGRSFAI